MGELASIDIELQEPLDVVGFIEYCLKNGWSSQENNKVIYLPLGDEDMFNWQEVDLNAWVKAKTEIQQKILHGEMVGIVLVDKRFNSGGELLIFKGYDSLSFSLSINVQRIGATVDFEFYKNSLKSALKGFGAAISTIKSECY